LALEEEEEKNRFFVNATPLNKSINKYTIEILYDFFKKAGPILFFGLMMTVCLSPGPFLNNFLLHSLGKYSFRNKFDFFFFFLFFFIYLNKLFNLERRREKWKRN
jgi:hypothetical protein